MSKIFLHKVSPPEKVNNQDIVDTFFASSGWKDKVVVAFSFGLKPNSKKSLPSGIHHSQKTYHNFEIYKFRRKVILAYLKANNLQLTSVKNLCENKTAIKSFFNLILRQHICEQIQDSLDLNDTQNKSSFDQTLGNIQQEIAKKIGEQTSPLPFLEVDVPPDGNCFYHALMVGIIFKVLAGKIAEDSNTAKKLKKYLLPQIAKLLHPLTFNSQETLKQSFAKLLGAFNYADETPLETHQLLENINWIRLLSIGNLALRTTMLNFANQDKKCKEKVTSTILSNLNSMIEKNQHLFKSTSQSRVIQDNYFLIISQPGVWAGEPEKYALATRLGLCIAPYDPFKEDQANFNEENQDKERTNYTTGELAAGDKSHPLIQIRLEHNHFYLGLPRADNCETEAQTLSSKIKLQQETPFLSADFLLKNLQTQLTEINKVISALKKRGYPEDYSVIKDTESLVEFLKTKETRLTELVSDKSKEPKQSEVHQLREDCLNKINNALDNPKSCLNSHRKIGPVLRAFADMFVALAYVTTLSLSHKAIRLIPGWSNFTLFSQEKTKSYNRLKNASDNMKEDPLSLIEELIYKQKNRAKAG